MDNTNEITELKRRLQKLNADSRRLTMEIGRSNNATKSHNAAIKLRANIRETEDILKRLRMVQKSVTSEDMEPA